MGNKKTITLNWNLNVDLIEPEKQFEVINGIIKSIFKEKLSSKYNHIFNVSMRFEK